MVDFLFDDIFTIEKVDPDGKKFDKVQSEKRGVSLILDVNTEIYLMHEKEKFLMVLSRTLNWSGAPVAGKQGQLLYYTFEVNLGSGHIKIMSIINGRKFHPQIHVKD